MSITETFDLAIKLSEKNVYDDGSGYDTGTKVYKTYMSEEAWLKFRSEMTSEALEQYANGGGSELEEKKTGTNIYPPKMASYGSSSRMIYNLGKDIKGFTFEKKLSTTVGGQANLDGFYSCPDRDVFVEAKCHEPYCEKSGKISTAYAEVYEYINEHADDLKCDMPDDINGKTMNVVFYSGDKCIAHFDIKQMICHLLGVATGVLNGRLNKKCEFLYLLYDPENLQLEDKTRAKIMEIYSETCNECRKIDFKNLYFVILDYLIGKKNLDVSDKSEFEFAFRLCNQNDFKSLVKNGIPDD